MRDEEREVLRTAFKEVHDSVQALYPTGPEAVEEDGQHLRNRLLVVDLSLHLADEVIGTPALDEQQVAERATNLMYAVRLVAPQHTSQS